MAIYFIGCLNFFLKVTCTENLPNPYNITRTFIVIVVNVNEAPRGISITPNTIAENLDPRSIVGKVSAVDPDNEVWILLSYSLSCVVPLIDFIHKCYGISSNIFPIWLITSSPSFRASLSCAMRLFVSLCCMKYG